ncbi:MAG TPA: hypothetical protein VFS00_06535, partial [Polyangiaceae bacterium]|nr:hypothetical protein [Polyangiaceae bacterium]
MPSSREDHGPSHAGEADDDRDEVRWHVGHVRARLSALRLAPEGLAAGLFAELERRLADLDGALAGGDDGGGDGGGDGAEGAPLVRHQGALRQLYQALALLETSPDWHSSPGSLSHPVRELTPLSHVPGYNDYQRGFLPWLCDHERHFLGASQPQLAGRALLFSSGMGAIQTALQFVMARAKRLLLGKRTYYETQTLLALAGARERLLPLDEAESGVEALAERVRGADAVFLDTVTLDRAAIPLDVPRLYAAIEASGRAGIELVLDNTVPGPRLALPPPPPGVRLYLVESLLKNYQAGLDLAAAGMLALVASPDAERDASAAHEL